MLVVVVCRLWLATSSTGATDNEAATLPRTQQEATREMTEPRQLEGDTSAAKQKSTGTDDVQHQRREMSAASAHGRVKAHVHVDIGILSCR